VNVREVRDPADADWLEMRLRLWPDHDAEEHLADMERTVGDSARFVTFLAESNESGAVGFAQVSIRTDYVNGTTSTPVAFLEGIYVRPAFRRRGVATSLCQAAEAWGWSKGCTELASDALIDNDVSHRMHIALGFEETERVVYFKKPI
jgi:aminoglycoside 6'-N-acetyltransferase I